MPQFCEAIFQGIDKKKAEGSAEYEVTFSMLEIYNEQVRDLLDPKGASKKGGLRVRQHPKNGFYGTTVRIIIIIIIIKQNTSIVHYPNWLNGLHHWKQNIPYHLNIKQIHRQ